jgi:hypothetical protein
MRLAGMDLSLFGEFGFEGLLAIGLGGLSKVRF